MKPYVWLFVAALGASCAAPNHVVIDRVGPAQANPQKSSDGTLIVYSAWEGSIDDTEHPHHAPFTLCSNSGEVLKKVRNWSGGLIDDPTPIALPAGDYEVKAHAQSVGTVTIPIRIESGRATTIYLDDSTRPESQVTRTNAVTLPDGRIVGWRAN